MRSGQITHFLLTQRLEPFRLALLLLILLDLAGDASPLVVRKCSVIRRLVLLLLGFFVFSSKFQRATNLLDEFGQLLRRLRRHGFHISLEHEEVLRFDENVLRDECLVVGRVCSDFAVEPVL